MIYYFDWAPVVSVLRWLYEQQNIKPPEINRYNKILLLSFPSYSPNQLLFTFWFFHESSTIHFTTCQKWNVFFFFLKRYTCLIFQFSHDFIFYLFASRIFTYLSSVLSPKFGIKNLHESESCSVVSDSLWLQGLYAMEFSREEYWCGSLPLLLGIFPTQGSNPGLLHCGWILYQLSHKGSPRILEWVAYLFSIRSSQPRNWTRVSCIAGRFFTSCAIEVIKMRTNKVIGKDVRIHALLTLFFL